MSAELIYHVVNFIGNIIIYYLVYLVFGKFHERRSENRMIPYAVVFLGAAGLSLINLSGINMLNAIYLIISYEAECLILFKAPLKKSLLHSFLFCASGVFVDVLSTFMLLRVWNKTLVTYAGSFADLTIGCFLTVLISLLAYKIFSVIYVSRDEPALTAYEIVFILCLTVFQFFVIYVITLLSDDTKGTVLIITTTGFFILDICVIHLIGMLSKNLKNKYEIDSVKLQNKIQLEHFEELNRKYVETSCMLHDIEKHISAIESLSQTESFSQAEKYTAALRNDIAKMGSIFRCSNKLLSAVLSQKMSSAESKGIKVASDIEDLTLDFMEDSDITAIFANLLDNAIEACEKADGEKTISIKMNKVNELIFISVENSFSGQLVKRGDVYRSTKAEHKGLGLTSIKIAAEKYGGYLNTDQNGDKFIADVVIPVK